MIWSQNTHMMKTMFKHTRWCFDHSCCYCNCQGTRGPLCFLLELILKYTYTHMWMSKHRNTWSGLLSSSRLGDTQTGLTDYEISPAPVLCVSVSEREEERGLIIVVTSCWNFRPTAAEWKLISFTEIMLKYQITEICCSTL